MAMHELSDRAALRPTPGIGRRRLTRLSLGHLIMIVAGLLAFLVNLSFLRSVDDRTLVAVAARDMPAGSRVSAADFHLVPVGAEGALLERLVTEDRLEDLEGFLGQDIEAGGLVELADVVASAAPDGLRAMSIPIDSEHAVGGALRAGDVVDVIAVEDGTAGYVLIGARVLAVAGQASGPLGTSRGFYVTLALGSEEALLLAEALAEGSVEVVRSTGAEPPTQPPAGGEEAEGGS